MSYVYIAPELKFLIKTIERLYKTSLIKKVSINEIDINKFFVIAQNNNLLFYSLQTIIKNNDGFNNCKEFILQTIERGKDTYRKLCDALKDFDEHADPVEAAIP